MTKAARAAIATFLDTSPGPIGLAVSGGGDSMALLHLIADAKPQMPPKIITINHGLRPEAAAEAAFVARVCATLALTHTTLMWDGWQGRGNVQAVARTARYQMLASFAQEHGLNTIALGHTADDVAETFLMRLARGAGVEGLAAMPSHFQRHGVAFARPLLAIDRAALREYLSAKGAAWVEDPSNDDTQFQRVRMRQLLPQLDVAGLGVAQLAQTAHRLRDAQAVLRAEVENLAAGITADAAGQMIMPDELTARFAPEIQRQFWMRLLQWMGNAPYPPRAEALNTAIDRARHEGRAQLAGCEIVASQSALIVYRESRAVANTTCPSDQCWDGKWQLSGPDAAGLMVRSLGETGLKHCPDWKATGYRRGALIASPAVFAGESLVAAPVAGLQNGWTAQIVADFTSYLASH